MYLRMTFSKRKYLLLWRGEWLDASAYMSAWSVIGRLMVHASSVPFTMSMFTRCLRVTNLPQPVTANWFNKGRAMYYHACVITDVKDP